MHSWSSSSHLGIPACAGLLAVGHWLSAICGCTQKQAIGRGAGLRRRAGFVLLVEVALAIFVLSIGVVAGVALIGSAIDSAAMANADAQTGMFADGVLNGLRALSQESAATNGWEAFWVDFANGNISVPVAAEQMWTNAPPVRAGSLERIAFTNWPSRTGAGVSVRSHALRYRLDTRLVTDVWGSTNAVRAMLRVWEGEFGGTNERAAQVFYSEYRNWGDM